MGSKASLRAELVVLRADFAGAEDDLVGADRRITQLLSVLCWYADPARYDGCDIETDRGERALRAIAGDQAGAPCCEAAKPPTARTGRGR